MVEVPQIGLQAGAMPQFQAGQASPLRRASLASSLPAVGQGMEQLGAGLLRLQDPSRRQQGADLPSTALAEFCAGGDQQLPQHARQGGRVGA
jgi:hypothetical protein